LGISRRNAEGQISRDHSFPCIPPGHGIEFPIYSLVVGKWTTFRAFAEQVTDYLLQHHLKRTRVEKTDHLPIGGGKGYPQTPDEQESWLTDAQKMTQLPRERLDILLNRYGTRAKQEGVFLSAALDTPLRYHKEFSQREIMFMAECEQVVHLDDLVLRRTLIALLGQLDRPLLEEIAGILAAGLG
jgi:glycerol-3-phosphate dehydrogenase